MNWTIFLDLLLVALLLTMIACALVLNRRIGRLRRFKDELEALIKGFGDATTQAATGIDGLKLATDNARMGLQPLIDEARSLAEDLRMLNARGERLADQLRSASSPLRRQSTVVREAHGAKDNIIGLDAEPTPRAGGQKKHKGTGRATRPGDDNDLIKTLERMR